MNFSLTVAENFFSKILHTYDLFISMPNDKILFNYSGFCHGLSFCILYSAVLGFKPILMQNWTKLCHNMRPHSEFSHATLHLRILGPTVWKKQRVETHSLLQFLEQAQSSFSQNTSWYSSHHNYVLLFEVRTVHHHQPNYLFKMTNIEIMTTVTTIMKMELEVHTVWCEHTSRRPAIEWLSPTRPAHRRL